jgi:hypothetical protein
MHTLTIPTYRSLNVSLPLAACFLALFTTGIRGEEKPWWNPFQKSTASSPLYGSQTSTSKKTSWIPSMSMPKMPWSSSGPKVNSYSKNKTSTMGKISKTSKRWWNNTMEALDPYPDPKPPKYSSESSSEKKGNWFTGMFQRDEPKKIETVSDWLKQESPKF